MKAAPYITSWERMGREEGLKIGLEQGLSQGRQEGRQEGLSQGREEGRQEGREEGREEGSKAMQESIIAILEERFEKVPMTVRKTITSQKDLLALQKWLRLAVKVDCLEDFKIKAK